MKLRVFVPLAIAACTIPGLILTTWIAFSLVRGAPADAGVAEKINPLLTLAYVVTLLVSVVVWLIVRRYLLQPLTHLAREAQRMSLTPTDRGIEVPRDGAISEITKTVANLGRTLQTSNEATESRVADAASLAEAQKRRLEAILLDLTEGVIVCSKDHRIILYNKAAQHILGLREMTGLGRSLFGVLTRDPILHTFDIMLRSEASRLSDSRRFMVSTVDHGTLIETRMSLIQEASGAPAGYVLSFEDIGPQLESLAARDTLLREVMAEWRRPIANLSAAIETFTEANDMTAEERKGFDEILRKEISYLSGRFNVAARRVDLLDLGHWGAADVYSIDLFRSVERMLAAGSELNVRLVGLPMWINADSHALTLVLTQLIRRLETDAGIVSIELGMIRSGALTYIEIGWNGTPIASSVLDSWLDDPLAGAVASRSARQILEHHGGEAWSSSTSETTALLRIALRSSDRHQRLVTQSAVAANPPRPEYYDFDLFREAPPTLFDARLNELRYVVFDTETTGLHPSQGDEMLSIGAVQVLNGRILTGETFERLINPERDIPASSIRFHGITSEMVEGKPPARIVLPQFRSFVGDAILVGYNISFDMMFLHKRQEEAGVTFDNPALDALLLAIYVFPDHPDPSLSSMANFLEIEVEGRHTALGDAMMTAAVWVRLIEGLEKKGVTTFGEAVEISNRMLQERRLNEKF